VEVLIRPPMEGDAADLYEVQMHPQVARNTMGTPSLTLPAFAHKFKSRLTDAGFHTFVAEVRGKAVGEASLRLNGGRRWGTGELVMMVHPQHQGCGIGTRLMEKLLDLADNWLGLRRVELGVYPDNAPAIRLYEKFGFEVEGRRRQVVIRDGEYIDDLVMARLRPRDPAEAVGVSEEAGQEGED